MVDGEILDYVAEQPILRDGCIEKVYLLSIFHLNKVEPMLSLLDHQIGHRTTQHMCRHLGHTEHNVSCSAQFLNGYWVVSSLVQVLQCLGLV